MSDKFLITSYPIDKEALSFSESSVETMLTSLFNKLVSIGAIVEDDVDEVSILKNKIDDIDNDLSAFHLHINPTLDCTFRCWYCYENHHKGSRMTDLTISAVCRLLSRQIRNPQTQKVYIGFFGGEPLIRFNMIAKPIIEHALNECKNEHKLLGVQFTTNGYLLNNEISEYLGQYGTSLQVTLDGGRMAHNEVRRLASGCGSYDRILNNIKRAISDGCNITLRINYTTYNIDSISGLIEDILALNIVNKKALLVDFQRVWQDRSSNQDDLSSQIRGYIQSLKEVGILAHQYHNTHIGQYSCYGDKRNHVLVNYNGDIYQCTARDFVSENRSGYLNADGSIIWENNSLERRMSSKFSREVCWTCRIAPLCGGGCRTQALESKSKDSCIYSYSQTDKDKVILNRSEYLFL